MPSAKFEPEIPASEWPLRPAAVICVTFRRLMPGTCRLNRMMPQTILAAYGN